MQHNVKETAAQREKILQHNNYMVYIHIKTPLYKNCIHTATPRGVTKQFADIVRAQAPVLPGAGEPGLQS